MNEIDRKTLIRQTFDTVSSGYDRPALRYFPESAAHLAEALELCGHEHVLDVATGTGAVALALAQRLPGGRVTAIDLSDGMLSQARAKACAQGLGNVAFQVMDMTALTFPAAHFDCATAAFALFFVEDMAACLRQIAACLKPGGKAMACVFSGPSFSPNADLFLERIQRYGVAVPPLSWKRLGDAAANHDLFAAAGLEDIRVTQRDLSYTLPTAEAWWEVLWYAGFRGLLNQLPEAELARFRSEHLAEIAALDTGEGIPMRVEVLYAQGRKAAERLS